MVPKNAQISTKYLRRVAVEGDRAAHSGVRGLDTPIGSVKSTSLLVPSDILYARGGKSSLPTYHTMRHQVRGSERVRAETLRS